jgi:uncharacterized protein (DUF983 family)
MGPLWQGKCPRCAKAKVFKHPAFNLWRFMEMHDYCPECNASFQPEPGFYFGAMFISYAITVAIMVAISLVLWLFFDPPTSIYIYTFLASVVLATPFSYRYSRLIWLYWFGGHTRQ